MTRNRASLKFLFTLIVLAAMPSSKGLSLLGQSLNIDAVKALGKVIASPGLAVPHIAVPHIGHVNWPALAAAGIKGVVFDKDNTLTAPYVNTYDSRIVPAVAQCEAIFGSHRLVILSNSAGGPDDPGYADATAVEASLGMVVLRRQSKKPKGFDELLAWFNNNNEEISTADDGGQTAVSKTGVTFSPGPETAQQGTRAAANIILPHELCMVGDRSLTDVTFGNMHGMLTVHVGLLTSKGDNKVGRSLKESTLCVISTYVKVYFFKLPADNYCDDIISRLASLRPGGKVVSRR